jgi:hypothetical protein
MPQSANSKHWLVLLVLLFLLIGVPMLSWLIARYTGITVFVIPILIWIGIPASLFGTPLFRPAMVGYDPVGIAGWSVAFLFYVVIALLLWAVIHVFLSLRGRRRI